MDGYLSGWVALRGTAGGSIRAQLRGVAEVRRNAGQARQMKDARVNGRSKCLRRICEASYEIVCTHPDGEFRVTPNLATGSRHFAYGPYGTSFGKRRPTRPAHARIFPLTRLIGISSHLRDAAQTRLDTSPADPRSATQPERYPSMFARSRFAFRALPLVVAAASALLLLPAAHAADAALATQAGFRQMTVTASSADDKPAHFALYYPTPDAARVIPMGPFPQTVAINGA